MWSKLDDALIDHRKIIAAGELLGANGRVLAIGFYVLGLLWSNKHLTDGYLPDDVVRQFHAARPLRIADALVRVGLWEKRKEKNLDGFFIHDFKEFNYLAREVKERREKDRLRKRNGSGG